VPEVWQPDFPGAEDAHPAYGPGGGLERHPDGTGITQGPWGNGHNLLAKWGGLPGFERIPGKRKTVFARESLGMKVSIRGWNCP